MTVAFKSPLTASNLNAKLISRTTDQSASGVIDFENGIKIDGDAIKKASGAIVVEGSGGVKVPTGNTAARATSGDATFRYNSETNKFEGKENGTWTNFISAATTTPISAKTADYTTTDSDEIIFVDGSGGAFAITLHTPSVNQRIIIKRTDNTLANVVSVTGTVDGVTNKKLHTQHETYEFVYSTSLAVWRQLNHQTETAWTSYTPTISGFGTVSGLSAFWKRRGTNLIVKGWYVSGTVAASLASITLPSGTSILASSMELASASNAASPNVGQFVGASTANSRTTSSLMAATTTSTTLIYFGPTPQAVNQLLPQNGNACLSNSEGCSFRFEVPVTDWQP